MKPKVKAAIAEELVCQTKPLCFCLGVAKDAGAKFECNCLRDASGRRCMVCRARLVTVAEFEAAS